MSETPSAATLLSSLQQRADLLRIQRPDLPTCKDEACENCVDITLEGVDTCCPYHRMLWDVFMYDEMDRLMEEGLAHEDALEQTRKNYVEWAKNFTKEQQDALVVEMAQDPLNWMC